MPEMHPLVELLLKRMDSHPDEFYDLGDNLKNYPASASSDGRWSKVLLQAKPWMTSEEQFAIHERLRIIVMDRVHNEAMDELLNGDERRREIKLKLAQGASAKGALATAVQQQAAQTALAQAQQNMLQSQQLQGLSQASLLPNTPYAPPGSASKRSESFLYDLISKWGKP